MHKAEAVREDKAWQSLIQRVALDCPRCNQTWLILGADHRDHPYICKACGHSFKIEDRHRAMKKRASGD